MKKNQNQQTVICKENQHEKAEKKLIKSAKGITLIALVITIIVLLILAGVTIAMLTGQNGILTNATNANSSSVYHGAEEQVKLAYMSVRTQIMTEKVANSSYDATEASNVTALTDIVKKDLNTTKGTDNVTEGFGVTASGSEINIIYKNSKIYQGTISSNPVKPSTNGQVTYTITLGEQSAGLTADGEPIAVADAGSGGGSNPGADPEPAVDPEAGIGTVNNTYKGDFGKLVSGYSPDKGSNWRLFYADSTSAYLISDSIGNTSLDNTSIVTGWNTSTITTLGKNLNPKYTGWNSKTAVSGYSNNEKAVAALLDTDKWKSYKSENATWAIGAPPLEMFIASYNAKHTIQLESQVNATGYKINKNGGAYDNWLEGLRESGKESLDDAIYCPSSGYWWLASPSAKTRR